MVGHSLLHWSGDAGRERHALRSSADVPYLATLPSKIDERVYADLSAIAQRHSEAETFVEKAVDVFLAVDVVTMAMNNLYDAAYLLTADGDFTPAVNAARALGKKVYAASCVRGLQLSNAVNASIQLPGEWFDDCFVTV